MLNCSIWFSAQSFWMGGGLESRCVGRVYGADGAVRRPSSGAFDVELQHKVFCTEFLDGWCGLDSRCVGRVYDAEGAVRRPSSGAFDVELHHKVFCTEFLDG